MSEFSTPLMRQYSAIKERHPSALLFFRLGDFYELFFEDAIVAAKELQITLTARNKEKGQPVPMCGVPYHAAEGYIARLIRKGFRVAICDQMEDPRAAKKLVKREVTRVLTPGTAIDSQVLEPRENNYLAAVAERNGKVGLALADLSTGEFRATEFDGPAASERLLDELERARPREVLIANGTRSWMGESAAGGSIFKAQVFGITETPLDDWIFSEEYGARQVCDQLKVATLAGFGLEDHPQALAAAGAILHYARETQRGSLDHFDTIRFFQHQDSMLLDPATLRNLEIVESAGGGDRDATLLATLDQCVTPSGGRLLKNWLLHPSLAREEIEARWDAAGEFAIQTVAREELRRILAGVQDVERLLSKITLETANARDMLALGRSLELLPLVRKLMGRLGTQRLRDLYDRIDELPDVHELLKVSIHPEPPAVLNEGNLIRPGYNAELDELREISRNARQLIAGIESRERERTRIASLKVRFNNVFGYYIEVSKPNLHLVPADYDRKQTLVNAERFTTPELKDLETKVLDAQERIQAIERTLFTEIRRQVAAESRRIRQSAQALSELDVLACFGWLAAERNYRRPEISEDGELVIALGRHPVVERIAEQEQSGRFVPNDLFMNSSSDRILLITGPNMGGKSTYLRQTALISIMAQIGSFVPADRAKLPIFDRLFTRIGASDNLARGRSTFMVEMTEVAGILNLATARSLVLLDEVGRGTATFDGLAIAWAVVEYLQAHAPAKTLFATHYHELTELADLLPGVRNYHAAVKESGTGIVFLRKVKPGSADKSYGIEVARLAGLPKTVIERAREILRRHEQSEHMLSEKLAERSSGPEANKLQLTIFTPLNAEVVRAIEDADLDNLKPLDALNLLAELKKQIKS